jgi:hypothetical protein
MADTFLICYYQYDRPRFTLARDEKTAIKYALDVFHTFEAFHKYYLKSEQIYTDSANVEELFQKSKKELDEILDNYVKQFVMKTMSLEQINNIMLDYKQYKTVIVRNPSSELLEWVSDDGNYNEI